MLMRFDPLRDLDRAFEQALGTNRQPTMALDAYREGDRFVIVLDLPGVDPASIELSIERNVLTVSASREWKPGEGVQVVANERRQGSFRRDLFLGENLDTERIRASYEFGVLTVTIPVAAKAKSRRIEVEAKDARQPITTGDR